MSFHLQYINGKEEELTDNEFFELFLNRSNEDFEVLMKSLDRNSTISIIVKIKQIFSQVNDYLNRVPAIRETLINLILKPKEKKEDDKFEFFF